MVTLVYLILHSLVLVSAIRLNYAQMDSKLRPIVGDGSDLANTMQNRKGQTSNTNGIQHPEYIGKIPRVLQSGQKISECNLNKQRTTSASIKVFAPISISEATVPVPDSATTTTKPVYLLGRKSNLAAVLGFQSSPQTYETANETSLSTEPTSLPTELPTSLPSAQPSALPSSQPTSIPSLQSSLMPSIEADLPSTVPSSRPTVQPTSQPTAVPTQFQAPSASPSSYPSSVPSVQPSNRPSAQPTSAPSGDPSSQPTSLPTHQPFAHPTSHPTAQPIAHPTARPSTEPSSTPSAAPSAVPSSMPSPGGEMGVNWWYLVTARCDLYADAPITQHEVLNDVVYAFSVGLTDHLNMAERETVEITAVEVSSTAGNSVAHRKLVSAPSKSSMTKSSLTAHLRSVLDKPGLSSFAYSQKKHRQGKPNTKSYTVETWCPDHPTALKVYQTMEILSADPTEIIYSLYERGVTEIENVTVSALSLATSTKPPPLDAEELSPVRITYVIIGTLVLFALAVLVLSQAKHFKHLYCSQTCVEDTARSWGNAMADGCMLCLRSVGLVSSDLRLYYGSGFDLTTQEEEADFYGETRSNLPSDNLDIHYGGSHRGLRAKYLEDDDETLYNGVSGAGSVADGGNVQGNSGYALPTSLPPKHGKIRTNIGKLFGKLRNSGGNSNQSGYERAPSEGSPSPLINNIDNSSSSASTRTHSPRGRMSPVQGHIEMSERGPRTGREVVSPLAVPARFALLSPPPPTPPQRYHNSNSNVDHGRRNSGSTFYPIATHGSKQPSGFYDHMDRIDDSIDDIGDFTIVPAKGGNRQQHKHNKEFEDEYESYVV